MGTRISATRMQRAGIFPDTLGPDYLPNVFRLQGELDEEAEYCASLAGYRGDAEGRNDLFYGPRQHEVP